MSEPTICIQGTLESWYFIAGRIVGRLYNDTADGEVITTSAVRSEVTPEEGAVIRTQNSHYYYLGAPHE
jgi:hypothetical protein